MLKVMRWKVGDKNGERASEVLPKWRPRKIVKNLCLPPTIYTPKSCNMIGQKCQASKANPIVTSRIFARQFITRADSGPRNY